MRKAGLVLVAVVLTAVAWWTASWVVPAFQRQTESARWPSVTGLVLRSQVMTGYSATRKGVRYPGKFHTDIFYEYTVDGHRLTADRLRFSPLEPWMGTRFGTTDWALAQSVVNAYPKGAAVPVYYDPQSPETALLQPGRTPFDWWFMLAPLAATALCGAAWAQVILGPNGERVAGFAIVTDGSETRILYDDTTPWTWAFCTIGTGAMVTALVFVIALDNGLFSPFNLSPAWAEWVYVAVLGLGCMAGAGKAFRRGRRDLVLDEQTLSLSTGLQRRTVPREALTGCDVVNVQQGGSRNDQAWRVRLTWTDHGEPWGADAFTRLRQNQGADLASWIHSQCKIGYSEPDFVTVLGVRMLKNAADTPLQVSVPLWMLLFVFVLPGLIQGRWGFWLTVGVVAGVGLWLARRWRARQLESMATENRWQYHDRMQEVPQERELPPHFTVAAGTVTTAEGRHVLVMSTRPLMLMWDASSLTSTIILRLDHPCAPFRCSRAVTLAVAQKLLLPGAAQAFSDADRLRQLYTTVGMSEYALATTLPQVTAWLCEHVGWDVTVWQDWLICTRPLVGKQSILKTIEQVQSLANGVLEPAPAGVS